MVSLDSQDETAPQDHGSYHYSLQDQILQNQSIPMASSEHLPQEVVIGRQYNTQNMHSAQNLPTMDPMAGVVQPIQMTTGLPGLPPNMYFFACAPTQPGTAPVMVHATPPVTTTMTPPVVPLVTPGGTPLTPLVDGQQRGFSIAPKKSVSRPTSSRLSASKSTRAEKIICREVYVPMEIVEGQYITLSDGSRIFMRKVRSMRAPIQVRIPGNTKWGSGYAGQQFLPQTAQHAIRQAACSQEWSDPSWENKSGCFLRQTTAGQHKDTTNTIGMTTLDPCFFSKDMEWHDLKRDSRVVYLPDPTTQMTQDQYCHYITKAAQLIGPTVNLPAPVRAPIRADHPPKRQRGPRTKGRYRDMSSELSEQETHEVDSDSDTFGSGTGTVRIDSSNTSSRGEVGVDDDDCCLHTDTTAGTCTTGPVSSLPVSTLACPVVKVDDSWLTPPPLSIGVSNCPEAVRYAETSTHTATHAFGNSINNPRRPSQMGGAMHTSSSIIEQSPSSQSALRVESGNPGSLSSIPIALDDDNVSPRERLLTDIFEDSAQDSAAGTTSLYLEAGFEDCQRQLKSDRLCTEFITAQEHLTKLERGIDMEVDLDLATPVEHRFWASFEDVLKEDRSKSLDGRASEHLECLDARRIANYGLTKNMIQDVVEPMLAQVPCLAPYSKFDCYYHFCEAALPHWQVWEALGTMDPLLTPEFVADHFEESMKQFRDHGIEAASLRPQCTEEELHSIREEYMKWRRNVKKAPLKSSHEAEYVQAKKRYEDAEHLMQVDQVAEVGLAVFRRFGSMKQNRNIYTLELTDGDELGAIMKMCDNVSKQNSMFVDFQVRVHIETDEGQDSLVENATVDAGGPTCRLITATWARLFDGSPEYHKAFVEGTGSLHHLSPAKILTPIAKKSVKLVGALMFLLVFKQQRVHRPMTMATIAHAMDLCPSRNDFRARVLSDQQYDMYVEDYKGFQPELYNVMGHLCQERKEGWEQMLDSIQEMSVAGAVDIWWRLHTKSKELKSKTEAEWCSGMKCLFADIMYDTLFVDCSTVGILLKQGFSLFVETARKDNRMSPADIKLVLSSSFDKCEMPAMAAFFTAQLGITSCEFLRVVSFSIDLPGALQSMFIQVVKEFSDIETYRLHRFITDETYVSGAKCRIQYAPERDPTALPTSSTCGRYIELPPYEDSEVMRSKLLMASYCTSYGNL